MSKVCAIPVFAIRAIEVRFRDTKRTGHRPIFVFPQVVLERLADDFGLRSPRPSGEFAERDVQFGREILPYRWDRWKG